MESKNRVKASKEEKARILREKKQAEEQKRAKMNELHKTRMELLNKGLHRKAFECINLDSKNPITASFFSEHLSLIANKDNTVIPIAPGSLIQIDTTVSSPQYMDRCVLVEGDQYVIAVKSNKPGVEYIKTEATATSREKSEIKKEDEFDLVGRIICIVDCATSDPSTLD